MFENNKLTKLLGIKYPIIQGGMAGVSERSLVSAVSNAGGLGVIGSGFATPEWLAEEIKETKKLTDKPFGVNLLLQNPNVAELVKIIIKEKVPVVFTGGGNPIELIPFFQQMDIKVIPVVPSSRLAAKMEANGADAVVVEGLESGGHIGENTTMCLIPQAKMQLKNIPLIGAGGIYDGKTMAAAMIMGADAVQIGTRFMVANECLIHENYKKAILTARDEDVIAIARFTGHPLRAIKNQLTENLKKMEERNPFPEEIKSERFAGSKVNAGNTDTALMLCGICAGALDKEMPAKDIIEEIVSEYETTIKNASELLN